MGGGGEGVKLSRPRPTEGALRYFFAINLFLFFSSASPSQVNIFDTYDTSKVLMLILKIGIKTKATRVAASFAGGLDAII